MFDRRRVEGILENFQILTFTVKVSRRREKLRREAVL